MKNIVLLVMVLLIGFGSTVEAATRIQLRNDTSTNWTSINPVLAQGERGVETDTLKEKSGDGSTAWNSLPYMGIPTEYNNGTCTTTKVISSVNGQAQKLTLGGNCTATFTQPIVGTARITLKLTQGASAYTFTGTSVKWSGGTIPTITTTASAVDFISCYLDGTNTYCAQSPDFK